MDPLSISTAIVTFLGASATCARYLRQIIHNANHAPEEILAVSNEVADINVLLQDLQALLDDGLPLQDAAVGRQQLTALSLQIIKARALVDQIAPTVSSAFATITDGSFRFQKVRWLRRRPVILKLRQDLILLKQDINLSLTKINTATTTRIYLRLDQIQPLHTPSLGASSMPSLDYVTTLSNNFPPPPLDEQDADLAPASINQFERSWSSLQWRVIQQIANFGLMTFHLRRTVRCGGICHCVCHERNHLKSPDMLNKVLGQLFVGYAGLPIWTSSCTEQSCRNQYSRLMQISYSFPSWLLSKVLDVTMAMTHTNEPQIGLRLRDRLPDSENSIFHLARQGNLQGVQALFEQRLISPNIVNASTGQTPLHFAIEHPHGREVANFLLDRVKIDAFLPDDVGWSVAHSVSQRVLGISRTDAHLYGSEEIFAKISADHADIWHFNHIHNLVVRTHQGDLETTLLEPRYRKLLNSTDAFGRTPLYWACLRGDVSKITSLLLAGADDSIKNTVGATALHAAAESGHAASLELLLRRNANVHVRDNNGYTPLHTAAFSNNKKSLLELLYAAGASVNTSDKWGTSILASAACLDHPRVAEWLLQKGAEIDSQDVVGCTPLYEAVRYCSDSVVEVLFRHTPRLDLQVSNGRTVLHALAVSGTLRCTQIFRENALPGLKADARDQTGATPWDLFQARIGKPEGMQDVFLHLLNHIREPSLNNSEEEVQFFDASEQLF